MPRVMTPAYVRVQQRVEWRGGCLIYTGLLNRAGYGVISEGPRGAKKDRLVHRVVYEVEVGPIPDGYEIDHRCRVRACVWRDHLEAVTPLENKRRVRRETCEKGHLMITTAAGRRRCRTCKNEYMTAYNARKRGQ